MTIRLGRNTGRKGDRGATLVEAALVTPVFVLVIFGVIELGLLFRDSLTTDNASREGARAASTQGSEAEADYYVLRTIEHGLEAMGLERLEYVVVFSANGPGDTMPAGCATASQPGVCNHYTAADFFVEMDDGSGADTGQFRCGSLDSAWCPTTRQTALSTSSSGGSGYYGGSTFGTGFVGVHVQTRHNYITGFFGDGTDLGETTIMRLEPSAQ